MSLFDVRLPAVFRPNIITKFGMKGCTDWKFTYLEKGSRVLYYSRRALAILANE